MPVACGNELSLAVAPRKLTSHHQVWVRTRGTYPKRSFQPQPVPARFAWFTARHGGALSVSPFLSLTGVYQPSLDRQAIWWYHRESNPDSSAWKADVFTSLHHGTIKQDSTFACSVVVLSAVTTGREVFLEWLRSSWARRPLPRFSIWCANRLSHVIHWVRFLASMSFFNTQDYSWCWNQNSFLIFPRLPDKLIAEILALFGTVVFAIGIDPCRRFTIPSQVLLAEKKSFWWDCRWYSRLSL